MFSFNILLHIIDLICFILTSFQQCVYLSTFNRWFYPFEFQKYSHCLVFRYIFQFNNFNLKDGIVSGKPVQYHVKTGFKLLLVLTLTELISPYFPHSSFTSGSSSSSTSPGPTMFWSDRNYCLQPHLKLLIMLGQKV